MLLLWLNLYVTFMTKSLSFNYYKQSFSSFFTFPPFAYNNHLCNEFGRRNFHLLAVKRFSACDSHAHGLVAPVYQPNFYTLIEAWFVINTAEDHWHDN